MDILVATKTKIVANRDISLVRNRLKMLFRSELHPRSNEKPLHTSKLDLVATSQR